MDEFEDLYSKAIKVLEEGLEDSLQFYNYEKIDHRKISSTNMVERLNREIRRRTKVVGIFSSMDSYIRLITSYLIEYSEDWSTGRCYIDSKISLITLKDLGVSQPSLRRGIKENSKSAIQ